MKTVQLLILHYKSFKLTALKYIKKNIKKYRIKKIKIKLISLLTVVSTLLTLGFDLLSEKPFLILLITILNYFYYTQALKFSLGLDLKIVLIIIFLFKNSLGDFSNCTIFTFASIIYINFVLYITFYENIFNKKK